MGFQVKKGSCVETPSVLLHTDGMQLDNNTIGIRMLNSDAIGLSRNWASATMIAPSRFVL